MKLSERAMITTLSMGIWSGRLIDREVTDEVSETHKADLRDAGVYSKQLISKKFLRDITSAASVARQTHKLLTLPWDDNGDRILTATGYQHYTDQMRLRRHHFEANVVQFCKGIPGYITEAKVRLGTMFDSEDYPSKDEIQKKFSYDVEIKPVPESGDFRTKLSDASIKAITKDIEARSDARVEKAMQDVFKRVYDVTEKMSERLRAYKPADEGEPSENRFKDSLVYNVKEQADLLSSLNITGDPRVEQLQKQLLAELVEHSPEILRSNDRIRNKTADKAEAILAKVKKYMS